MENRKIITTVVIGVVIILSGLGIASLGEKIQASSTKEFVGEYGGFGIKGEWKP